MTKKIFPISVLCTEEFTSYLNLPYVFPWSKEMDVYNFNNSTPVITHAPCAQWSKMKRFANCNMKEKDLAFFCYEKVMENGGIFEHPAGSAFFKYIGKEKEVVSLNQHWFGFPSQKKTYLYFNKCKPGQMSINFNAVEKTTLQLSHSERSRTTLAFASWLTSCIWDSPILQDNFNNDFTGNNNIYF